MVSAKNTRLIKPKQLKSSHSITCANPSAIARRLVFLYIIKVVKNQRLQRKSV